MMTTSLILLLDLRMHPSITAAPQCDPKVVRQQLFEQ
jgi:hypothetical protein